MYSRNELHSRRKMNYARYQKMVEEGFSIAEDVSNTSLYFINEDPFGRAYYQKSLGEVVVRDPITGREFTQEEWATKEFIVDNKAQLIAKASADLVVGKKLTMNYPIDENADEEADDTVTAEDEWLQSFVDENDLETQVYESAIRNSALGDQYFELMVEEGEGNVRVVYIEPTLVYLETEKRRVKAYEIAWELDQEEVQNTMFGVIKKVKHHTLIQKKIHFPGKIRWELFEQAADSKLNPVPLIRNPANAELIDKALASPTAKTFLSADEEWRAANDVPETETENAQDIYVIEEYTGIDEPLIVHWPNYRIFGLYGVSDVGMVEELQNALNNRETQLNDVLDKHADPAMFGDDSYLNEKGNLVMTGGGGRFFPVRSGDNPPGFLEWAGHLNDAQTEIDRLYKAILDNTETSPTFVGMDKSGGVQSGRALMYRLIRSLCMRTRKSAYMMKALKDLVRVAQKVQIVWIDGTGEGVTEEPRKEWDLAEPVIETQSSIPTDTTEVINEVILLVKERIISRTTALEIVDKFFEEIEAEEEAGRLDGEQKKKLEEMKAQMPDLLQGITDGSEESAEIPPEEPAAE